jgi:hypothetical protein
MFFAGASAPEEGQKTMTKEPIKPMLYRRSEVAKLLGLSDRGLRRIEHTLPTPVLVGRRKYYVREEVAAAILGSRA